MKRILFIWIICLVGCKQNSLESRQLKAENAIKDYLHFSKDPQKFKNIQFTKIEINGNSYTIGIFDTVITDEYNKGITLQINKGRPEYFQLDSNFKVGAIYTD
jgi:hypothetical protein